MEEEKYAYSITVANKFSLESFAEDADPFEVLKKRELEKEARRIEKREKALSEKENKSKPEGQKNANAPAKAPKVRVAKDVAATQPPKNQENKKDQGEKKYPPRSSTGGEQRNVKFSGESREDWNNRRNREDGDKPRNHNDSRRGTGEGRNREFNDRREQSDRPERQNRDFGGERRERGDRPHREHSDRPERQNRDFGNREERPGGFRGGMNNRPSRGGARGGRGGGSFDNRGKREFDRQSGSDKTGVKPVDKKDGAGSHNWGSNNDEIEEVINQENTDWTTDWTVKPVEGENTTVAPTEVKEGEAPTAENSTEEKPVEEEAKELTLDEWKAQRSSRSKPQFNVRKAGEGEDPSRWKKMYALEKKKELDNEEDVEEEEYDATAEYPQRVGRQKRVLGIEINFGDSRRRPGPRGNQGGRGGRSDRGGRNFGNRGPPRDGDSRGPMPTEQKSPRGNRQKAPEVNSDTDFPSLG